MEDLLRRITEGNNGVYNWKVNGEDRIEVLERLLKNPKHVLMREPEVFSKVMTYEDSEVINVCLPHLWDVNRPLNKKQMTALHWSAERELDDVASKLLKLGARTECGVGYMQQTPLHIAAWKGNQKMIDILLRHKADVNARDGLENTPLLKICKSQCGDTSIYKCIKTLLKNGAEVNIHNLFKFTPLIACIRNRWLIGKLNYICHLLLEAGADPNLSQRNGNTPLHHLAWASGNVSDILAAAEILLNKGACINRTNMYGETPLYSAFSWGRWFLVDFLVENGADLGVLVKNGGDLNVGNGNHQILIPLNDSMSATSSGLKLNCTSSGIRELRLRRYFALKIVNKSYVCERAMNCIASQGCSNQCMENYLKEANALKARAIIGTNLTFFDIVHSDMNTICKSKKYNNLVNALESDYESFPIYRRCLKRRLDRILTRRKEKNSTLNIISDIFDSFPLNFLEQIVEQFSSNERQMLIEAFENDCFSDFSISDMLDLM